MIVKYLNDDAWGYIDNVRQAACKSIDCELMVQRYDQKMRCDENDSAEYMNGELLTSDVAKSNKVFMAASVDMADESVNRHSENLLEPSMLDFPAVSILVYLEDCKEYDAVLLVTNQKAFIMNDKGQTIERLN